MEEEQFAPSWRKKANDYFWFLWPEHYRHWSQETPSFFLKKSLDCLLNNHTANSGIGCHRIICWPSWINVTILKLGSLKKMSTAAVIANFLHSLRNEEVLKTGQIRNSKQLTQLSRSSYLLPLLEATVPYDFSFLVCSASYNCIKPGLTIYFAV